MTITSYNVIMQGDKCNFLHFVEWPKVTDKFNHTYQMKMMMIILHALNRQESLDKFSHMYLYQMQNDSFAILHLTSELWHVYAVTQIHNTWKRACKYSQKGFIRIYTCAYNNMHAKAHMPKHMCKHKLPYGANVWWCKMLMNGIACDFDEENFDECCCLPVKHALIIFLLLLHVLVANIAALYYVANAYLIMMFFSFALSTAVRGYHVHQDNWETDIGSHYYAVSIHNCKLLWMERHHNFW